MTPTLAGGWIIYECTADDSARVEIAIGDGEPLPAFRDWHDGTRVAKVRPPAGYVPRTRVRLIVDGTEVSAAKA